MLFITCDIDWAPEEIISNTLALFEKNRVKLTIFATHKSELLFKANSNLFEIGIHPKFGTSSTDTDNENTLTNLMKIYPHAKGVRSHSMMQSTPLLDLFAKHKLLYDANIFLPYFQHARPFRLWNGLLRIPFNWEDDVHMMYKRHASTVEIKLNEGFNVLNFHPIHIYLNSSSLNEYDKIKKYYKNPHNLKKYRNASTKPGAQTILMNVFQYIRKNNIKTDTLGSLINKY